MQRIFYTMLLYIVFFLLTYGSFSENKKTKSKRNIGVYVLLALALVFRLLISVTVEGHRTDIACFKTWAARLAEVGTQNFYAPDYFADYPPGYMLVLYVLGKIAAMLGFSGSMAGYTLLIKLPAMLADIVLGWTVYRCARENLQKGSAVSLAALVVLSPVIVLVSSLWGQIDSLFTLAMIASLLFIYRRKFVSGALLFAVCLLIKPQVLLIAPVYLCAYFGEKNLKMIGKSILTGLAAVFVAALPFTANFNFMWLIDKYAATLKSYPYATVNAYNFYALLGFNWKDISSKFLALPITFWSYAVILAVTAGSMWFYFKSKHQAKLFYTAYLIIAVMFTFGAKMHERYLFPALILLIFTYIFTGEKRFLFLFMVQSSAHFLNVGDVFISDINKGGVSPVMMATAAVLHIGAAIYSLYLAYDYFIPHVRREKVTETAETGQRRLVRADYLAMAVVTLVYSCVALWSLGDFRAPQTFANVRGGVVADLGEVRGIGSVMVYQGVGSGNYDIAYSADKVHWESYAAQKGAAVFAWRRSEAEVEARYLKIASEDALDVGEIGVVGSDGRRWEVSSVETPELTDEQSVVPQSATYMNGTYFDEVYHPRTAYELLHRLPPYETTHPPLGKLILSVGILLFKMTPFGWRIMGTLAGIAMLPMFYLICKRLVRRTDISAIATVLFAFDFMHFSQTRIGTIDSYAVLAVMAMFYFALEYFSLDLQNAPFGRGLKWLALCGMAFGIGAAVKWNCIYFAPAIAFIIVFAWIKGFVKSGGDAAYKKTFAVSVAWSVLAFVVIPSLIYFASYLPQISYDLHGRTPLGYVVESAKSMYDYHSELTADHAFKSKWYEWIINGRPLWAYIDSELAKHNVISSISSFGNPLVWWGGFAAMLYGVYLSIFKRNAAAILIFAGYASLLLPWVGITRVTFIYHYFPCTPFLVLATAVAMKHLAEYRRADMKWMYGYGVLTVLLFVVFYPVISGSPAAKWYVANVLTWFDSWTFFSG